MKDVGKKTMNNLKNDPYFDMIEWKGVNELLKMEELDNMISIIKRS